MCQMSQNMNKIFLYTFLKLFGKFDELGKSMLMYNKHGVFIRVEGFQEFDYDLAIGNNSHIITKILIKTKFRSLESIR